MSDALDQAIKSAAAQDVQPPTAIRFDIDTGTGKPPAVVILPIPVLDKDLFRIFSHLAGWYGEQERLRLEREKKGLVLAPADVALPPPPRRNGN